MTAVPGAPGSRRLRLSSASRGAGAGVPAGASDSRIVRLMVISRTGSREGTRGPVAGYPSIVHNNAHAATVPDRARAPESLRIPGKTVRPGRPARPLAPTITTQLRTIRGKFVGNLRGFCHKIS